MRCSVGWLSAVVLGAIVLQPHVQSSVLLGPWGSIVSGAPSARHVSPTSQATSPMLLRCPPGTYQGDASDAASADSRLRAHLHRLLQRGYRTRRASSADLRRSAARGFITFESPLWPKPAHCHKHAGSSARRAPRPILDVPPGTCEPNGTHCDKYRISRDYRFIWYHAFKVGTTSLSPYLSCNMRALPVAALLHQIPAVLPGFLHVGTARSPLPRLISAFQEVYSRMRVHPSRVGRACFHRQVPWLLVAGAEENSTGSQPKQSPSGTTIPCADPSRPLKAAALRAIFRQFVADLECGTHFPNVEHLYTQSLFLGGNTSVPHSLDMILHLETLDADLSELKRRVGFHQPEVCPMKKERVAASKEPSVPTASDLRQLLHEEPTLMRSLCNVYVQDFICLGYRVPAECAVHMT
jgi:hypothetical protein